VRLDDAFLYLVLDLDAVKPDHAADACEQAIAGGVDIFQLRSADDSRRDAIAAVAEVCRRDDALLVLANEAQLASELGAEGVHLDDVEGAVSQARLAVGDDGIVGVSSRGLDEARLAVAVGADYLVHRAGLQCRADFAGIGAGAAIPLFAGGIGGLEEARSMVELGLYRLCIDGAVLDLEGDLAGQTGEYSALLGRC